MNPDQTEKLKGLIGSSSILNENERQEWLTLLSLMNDKQAAELEKILTTASPARPQARMTPAILDRPTPASGTGGLPSQGDGKEESAPLVRILNFPKIREVDSSFAQTEHTQPSTTETKTGFLGKVQAALREKELPPGHPEAVRELELPPSTSSTAPAQGLEKGPDRDWQRSNVLSRMNHIQNLPTVSRSAAAPQQLPAKGKLPAVPKPAMKPQTVSGAGAGSSTGIGGLSPSGQKREAGTKPTTTSLRDQVEQRDLKAGLEKWPEFKQGAMSAGIVKTHEGLGLENLSDVSTLSAFKFSQHFVEDFEQKLKVLIKKHGYYTVLFNLEKSPLYKAYLNTGTQILGNSSDFEKIKSLQTSGHLQETNFLSQSEFENFADLLRRIQT